MPKIGQNDIITMGIAGLQGSWNQQYYPFGTNGGGSVVSSDRIIVSLKPDGRVAFWNPQTPQIPPEPIEPAIYTDGNSLAAGGGRWIAFIPVGPEAGLHGSMGFLPGAGMGHVAHDGTIAYKTLYQSSSGVSINHMVDGKWVTTQIPNALPVDIQALPGGKAIWRGGAFGRPVPHPFHADAYDLRMATAGGDEYLAYWSESTPGVIVNLNGTDDGLVVESRPVGFNRDIQGDSIITLAWSQTPGEAPWDLVMMSITRSSAKYVIDPLGPQRVVPTWGKLETKQDIVQIGRPAWNGCFVYGSRSVNPFGNADLLVDENMLIRAADGRTVACYTSAEAEGTIEALNAAIAEARRRHPNLVIIPYWPKSLQTDRLPIGTDTLGVVAYCGADETVAQCEVRVANAVARCKYAWLIAQIYTSNTSNTPNVRALTPMYARLMKEHTNIEGILAFEAGGTHSGWSSHPEIHDDWQRLSSGITGEPDIRTIVIPPRPPDPKPEPEPPVDPIFPPAKPWYGGSMTPTRVALRIGEPFLSVDPNDPKENEGKTIGATFSVGYDRHSPNCEFEMTSPDGKNLRFVHKPTGWQLECDGTRYSTSLATMFYVKDDTFGGYAVWDGYTTGDGKIHEVRVIYGRDDEWYSGPCLTVVEL